MRIVEMFRSLQGEGPIAGHPAFFVRFAGCNLKCPWCDTYYAQDPGGRLKCLTETEVWHSLAIGMSYENDALVFTGGEPFLQEDSILRLYRQIHTLQDIWFETNGTILPKNREVLERSWTKVVASPKTQQFDIPTLQALADRTELYLKFVIGPQAWDAEAAYHVAKKVAEGGQYSVADSTYFMAQGATMSEQLAAMPQLWQTCVKLGVKLSPRLHTLTFGNTRGV